MRQPTKAQTTNFERRLAEVQKALRHFTGFQQPIEGRGVVDLFCGAGGMSLGFAAYGHRYGGIRMCGGYDINPHAVNTYSRNFGRGTVIDIQQLAKHPNPAEALGLSEPCSILIGCPPCQGFSAHRKRSWEIPDQRNVLGMAFAEVAIKLDPDVIVLENVPEMLSSKYWEYWKSLSERLQCSGYIINAGIVEAATYGVPQRRFRTLAIASKQGISLPPPVLSSVEYKTVRDAISDLSRVRAGEQCPRDSLHRSSRHRKETISTIKMIRKNGGSRPAGVGPKCLDRVNGFYDVYGRLFWDRPSITITQYSRSPACGRFTHPEQNRGLTAREAARIQSFPDKFQFMGSFSSIFQQIGEAVPPLFACAVATWVVAALDGVKLTTKSEPVKTIVRPIGNSFSSQIAKWGK